MGSFESLIEGNYFEGKEFRIPNKKYEKWQCIQSSTPSKILVSVEAALRSGKNFWSMISSGSMTKCSDQVWQLTVIAEKRKLCATPCSTFSFD